MRIRNCLSLLESDGNEPSKNYEADDNNVNNVNSSVHVDTVDRDALLDAMTNSGYTVTSLASAVGVDPPMISRLLRKPDGENGRNPSMDLAAKICAELGVTVEHLFQDIFK